MHRSRFWRSFGVGLGWFAPSLMWIASFSPPGVIATVVFAALLGLAGLATPPGPTRVLALPAALGVSRARPLPRPPSAGCRCR
ncbi:MAG: hypothetical protein R2749_31445 [Acidimicrobiales bacterium]